MFKILFLLYNTNTSSSNYHLEEVWLRETAVEYHLVEIYQSLFERHYPLPWFISFSQLFYNTLNQITIHLNYP